MIRDDDVFADALALPEADRAAFLDRACGDDSAQPARVLALLRGHLEAPAYFALPARSSMPAEKPGDMIAEYRLIEQIGEGGCGVVWMAEQTEPVRRRVALKVIKLGMDTREVIARFEAERQALALMDHPNIAKVFDAGATATGRPYFVMELVRGIPITRYCDDAKLPTEERLRLFIQVCHAIQHAHQKGIIHRDIKPSNILVSAHDDAAVPQVIDFGIAKATQGRLTDQTVFTALEQFVGTPAYMSPEQTAPGSLDIDTRSDIYSLGVLLYELLTGRPPFDPKALVAGGLEEIRRVIREVDPQRPSTRLSTVGHDERATLAQHRGIAPAQLATMTRGDLDWIVMKCLEKSRARRYETANGLALDLQRHLRHEPVFARPPSRAYLTHKFVRRHRVGFGAAAAIAAVLVLGATLSTWQAIRAKQAEREQSRLRETAQNAQAAAEAQERSARRRAYASDMAAVQKALADGNLGWARQLLDRHRPQSGEQDLRDWEWRYLWRSCQSEAKSVLTKGKDAITAVAVSPDGNWVATEWDGSKAPNAILWNLQTGTREEIPLRGGVSHLAFSPREPILAMAANRGHVILWDLTNRTTVREWIFSSTGDRCTGLFFSEDGQTLVTSTAGAQNEIRTWRVATGEQVDSFPTGPTAGHHFWGYFAATRDLRLAAYVSANDGHVQVVDLVTRQKLWSARVAAEQVTALCFSPDGKTLASGEGLQESPIRLWGAWTGIELGRMTGHSRFVSQLVFSPDGMTLASASGDQTVRLWDVASRNLIRTLRGHTIEVYCLALLPDNKTLVSASKNGELFLWDTSESATRADIAIPGEVMVWRFSDDGRTIITVEPDGRVTKRSGENYRDHKTLLQIGSKISAAENVAKAILYGGGWLQSVTAGSTILAEDSPRLAHVSVDGGIEVWDWERGARMSVIAVNQGDERECVAPIGFADKGRKLFVTRLALQPRRLTREEWDVASGRQTRSWKPEPGSQNTSGAVGSELLGSEVLVSLSPDQTRFVSVASPAALIRTDLDSGSESRLELDLKLAVTMGVFSPDSSLFAVPTLNGLVQVANVHPLRRVTTLSGFLAAIHSVAFSPDGRRLATGSGGSEAMTLWDVGSYERVLTLPARRSTFRQAAFSPDGNVLGALSGNRERPTLQLWRAPTLEEIVKAEAAAAKAP